MLTSVALLGLINVRRKEEVKEQKHESFEMIKLRVTRDVLGEYYQEVISAHNLLDKTKAQVVLWGQNSPHCRLQRPRRRVNWRHAREKRNRLLTRWGPSRQRTVTPKLSLRSRRLPGKQR
ncbi:hypothetical protein J4Q44_G00385430 [Coregonus suidteri]|uniref:Uncharacterized protein n=1 Tax=Coregonus suidteri TaxID=861788 RepID=A0AAN8KRF1_9TELE